MLPVATFQTVTRLFAYSATNNRLLVESYLTSMGAHIPDWVVLVLLVVNAVAPLACPSSKDAFMPLVMLVVLNTSTRWFWLSATNSRLFVASKSMPIGLNIPDWVVAGLQD